MTYEEAKMQIQAIPEKIWDQLSEPDREAMEMAFSALQEQEAKTQLSAEGTTSDLISRQDAIEVIEEMQMPIMRSMFPEEQFVFKGMSEALSAIKDLPSAHPEIEERKEESAQNVPKEDLISRKAAIDVLATMQGLCTSKAALVQNSKIWQQIKDLPSAQPEPLVNESRTLVNDLVNDTIRRTSAIDTVKNMRKVCDTENINDYYDLLLAAFDVLPSAQPENQVHLCDSCRHVFPECPSEEDDVIYGNGKGNDNICACNKYEPSVQPERTCVNCGRTANNGGWYADGGTRCPIEEHYALPKDGFCHLWEKRNITDDDYPERREE